MELKGVYMMLMIMVILFIGTGNAVDQQCADRCEYLCGGPEGDYNCFYRCVISCPNVAQHSADDHECRDQQYYCKLGCSMTQCLKYNDDKVKTERCMDHCGYKTCNIKPAGAPAPSLVV